MSHCFPIPEVLLMLPLLGSLKAVDGFGEGRAFEHGDLVGVLV